MGTGIHGFCSLARLAPGDYDDMPSRDVRSGRLAGRGSLAEPAGPLIYPVVVDRYS